ncbi:unnamed protein product [Phyllotreta striolata]|uniref:Uncharacterized protein n=1 Tax=Phyllotreta striolata TaxID=444603 RepID=A0A9N9TRD4_PHYSR|nr:unnamed protein product [Phyllotreta striolata]
MFVSNLCVLLTLIHFGVASDLDEAVAIMTCAKAAFSVGVPELNVPSYEPFYQMERNFSFRGDIGSYTGAEVTLSQIKWTGLTYWDVIAAQSSLDSNPNAHFPFLLNWKTLDIDGHFDMVEDKGVVILEQHGSFSLSFSNSNWKGLVDVTKPTSKSNGSINDCQIDWSTKYLTVVIDGLGILDEPISKSIQTKLFAALNKHQIGNVIGEYIKDVLKTWWDEGKVWRLMEWCEKNPSYQ